MLDTQYFKQKLETEEAQLRQDLAQISTDKIHPGHDDFEAVSAEPEMFMETRDDIADKLENFSEREATTETLEVRLRDIIEALERIEKGTYGKCKISGEDIEIERLEANPAATTCKAHINEN